MASTTPPLQRIIDAAIAGSLEGSPDARRAELERIFIDHVSAESDSAASVRFVVVVGFAVLLATVAAICFLG